MAEDNKNNTEHGLTKREIECLLWCGHGLTNARIGKKLGLSSRTVEHYLASAIRKLGARNRTEAVYRASVAGILNDPEQIQSRSRKG